MYTRQLLFVGIIVGVALGFALPGSHQHVHAQSGPVAWSTSGNAGTVVPGNFLGTTDNQALELKVNRARALRLEPNVISPNVIGGFQGNAVTPGAVGSVIGGGGAVGTAGTIANLVTDNYGTVAGGASNRAGNQTGTTADTPFASIGGGYGNVASGVASVVGGGQYNTASHLTTTVGGGKRNTASAEDATIGGGQGNIARENSATVGGGKTNAALGIYSTVGGGSGNTAIDFSTTVGGGQRNAAFGVNATVGGGTSNTAYGYTSVIGGGEQNRSAGNYATIGGGIGNRTTADFATIGGGGQASPSLVNSGNRVTDNYGTVGGGGNNQAGNDGQSPTDRPYATVSGGQSNTASGAFAAVGGGQGNMATGSYSTVIGGQRSFAQGTNSVAVGRQARALHDGAFVWSDNNPFNLTSTGVNQFSVRATGGVRFLTGINASGVPIAGVQVPTGGGAWSTLSDKDMEANFASIDSREILRQLASLPIQEWNYRSQDASVRHIGPVAQDFARAFGVGEDERHISTVDADGVAFAAIQGLLAVVDEKDQQLASLQSRVEHLERQTQTRQQSGSHTPFDIWSVLILAVGLLNCAAFVILIGVYLRRHPH